jgi:hypothetical protein
LKEPWHQPYSTLHRKCKKEAQVRFVHQKGPNARKAPAHRRALSFQGSGTVHLFVHHYLI